MKNKKSRPGNSKSEKNPSRSKGQSVKGTAQRGSMPKRGHKTGAGFKKGSDSSGKSQKELTVQQAVGRLVVGIHAASEVLKVRPHEIHKAYFQVGWEENNDLSKIAELLAHHEVYPEVRKEAFFNAICPSHQGLCLDVTGKPQWEISEIAAPDEKSLVIILDEIEDPHNLGAIMRTAWLMGASAVVVPDKRATRMTPIVAKVASGGAEHIPLVVEKNLSSFIGELKAQQYWVYGLAGETTKSIWDIEFPSKTALVVGSEAKGLRSTVRNSCDEIMAIPQIDQAASYNASVALAISVAEVCRQWKSLEI